jgi:RNA polymerase sigma-70 factor (ECF subfamily)
LPPGRDGDGALCARAAAGDRAAFASLVARHEARLRGFLAHVAGPERGDELAQETFLKAWQSIRSFRGEAKFSSWLCSIGWRCFIDEIRRDRSEVRKREASAFHAEPEEHPSGDSRIDLARALGRLDAAERASLVLCEGHGWSHVEAAEILRVPLGTLKGTVARAKRKCREMLKDADG